MKASTPSFLALLLDAGFHGVEPRNAADLDDDANLAHRLPVPQTGRQGQRCRKRGDQNLFHLSSSSTCAPRGSLSSDGQAVMSDRNGPDNPAASITASSARMLVHNRCCIFAQSMVQRISFSFNFRQAEIGTRRRQESRMEHQPKKKATIYDLRCFPVARPRRSARCSTAPGASGVSRKVRPN